MTTFDPASERVHVMRELITAESGILKSTYFEGVRDNPDVHFVQHQHVSLLTRNEVREIAEKYPKDHPKDLIIEALGELMLPPEQSALVSGARVFGGKKIGLMPRFYVASPLAYEGIKEIQEDTAKILGFFGLERTLERQNGDVYEPHVSLLRVNSDRDYADRIARETGVALRLPKPIVMSHPIVDHRQFDKKPGPQKRLLFDRLAITP